ncbi:MAG: hypothetical protein ACYDA3_08940 [Gaiellaceae bacterium]
MKKLVLLVALTALAVALVPARAHATDSCGRPIRSTNWIDFGWPALTSIFARPGSILAVSSGEFPAQMRAAGAVTVYFDLNFKARVGIPSAPADPAAIVASANRLYDYASAQTACSTPWIAENELFGASLATPWSVSNTTYRNNVLVFLQTLAARGARPFLLVNSTPYTAGDAATWWQQVAAVSDIVRETYLNDANVYKVGPIVGNRQLRTAMRNGIDDFTAIGIPTSKLGVMLGFQTTKGTGGREGLQPAQAWFEVVKWQALAARQVAKELRISTIWSWGWGEFNAPESDPDKPAAACVWLWTRAHALCDAPAVAGPNWDASVTEGQIRLPAGVKCQVGKTPITDAAIAALARLTGDPETAASVLLARVAAAPYAPVTTAQVLTAERVVIATRFGGDANAYRTALAQAGATVDIARGALTDALRRAVIEQTLKVAAPTASEIQTFYESYPELLVRRVTADPAPAWLGGAKAGYALDLIAPDGIFQLATKTAKTLDTIGGTYRVKATEDARPLGSMPLSTVASAINAALTSFAQGAAYETWLTGRQTYALNTTTCRADDLPAPGVIELESFLPFLSATG